MSLISTNPTSFDREVALLNKAGVTVAKQGDIESRFMREMESGGLTPEDICATIAGIMNNGENSNVKLSAAKMALSMHMHPAFVPRKEAERKEAPVINLHISGGDVKIQQILTPVVSED